MKKIIALLFALGLLAIPGKEVKSTTATQIRDEELKVAKEVMKHPDGSLNCPYCQCRWGVGLEEGNIAKVTLQQPHLRQIDKKYKEKLTPQTLDLSVYKIGAGGKDTTLTGGYRNYWSEVNKPDTTLDMCLTFDSTRARQKWVSVLDMEEEEQEAVKKRIPRCS